MPAAVMKVSPAGYLELSEEQQKELISSKPIEELYDVEEEPFARGKYAAVRRCVHRATGQRFAAKYLRKWRRAADLRPEILHEVAILDACRRSPRVVKLFSVFESDHEMVLLLELAKGGELQMLLDRDIVPDEGQVRQLMHQILMGLLDLHEINVAHLDIKPQNLVLTGDFPDCDVKLCDLGISRYIGDGADIRDMMGTPDYVAPEVLNYEPISLATDMWSIGVVIYVLLTGCSPFGGDTKQETFCNISQCNLDFPEDLFEDVSEEAIDLMRKLMIKEPSKRLTVQQSLKHSWFSASPVSSPISPVSQDSKTETAVKPSTPVSSRVERTKSTSPVTSRKFEKLSPALSKKLDRPSPTLIRKPGKELPEPIKGLDITTSSLTRTTSASSVNITEISAETTSRIIKRTATTTTTAATIITTTASVTVNSHVKKESETVTDSNVTDRSATGMRSFRKNTFKKNMGSILERIASCEDFENNNSTIHRSISENASKTPTRISTTSKKVPAPETPEANSNASIASLTVPRLMNRATAIQTMPVNKIREFKFMLQNEAKISPMVTPSENKEKTASRNTSTTTITTTTNTTTTIPTPIPVSTSGVSGVSLVLTPSSPSETRIPSRTLDEKDCLYTFRKCYIVDDCENENGNSLVSDGTNESEASSGYYDNSSCCSSSDSVSDVSETSNDLSHDRLSTASMDSLDSCYGKERRLYSSTLSPFHPRNNLTRKSPGHRIDPSSKVQHSHAFHQAISTFNRMLENSNQISHQQEMVAQEKIFASAKKQAAKASHTTVINKVSRASFVTSTPTITSVTKACALNITRENGNEVVLQEVKSGKCSRFSEVKIESVQSRIKKFQS